MKTYEYRTLHIGCYGQEIWLEWVECPFDTASLLEQAGDPMKVQVRTIILGVA